MYMYIYIYVHKIRASSVHIPIHTYKYLYVHRGYVGLLRYVPPNRLGSSKTVRKKPQVGLTAAHRVLSYCIMALLIRIGFWGLLSLTLNLNPKP